MKNKKTKPLTKNEENYVLVYSTAKPSAKRCSGCNRILEECVCKEPDLLGVLKPTVRIERKGRGGKIVTILAALPENKIFLKDLCAYLKQAVGAGGTYYTVEGAGIIEIQGDRRDVILELIKIYRSRS